MKKTTRQIKAIHRGFLDKSGNLTPKGTHKRSAGVKRAMSREKSYNFGHPSNYEEACLPGRPTTIGKLNRQLEPFDDREVSRGIEVEKEHTKDVEIAKQIALDHLKEDPHYYAKLRKVEPKEQTMSQFSNFMEEFLSEVKHIGFKAAAKAAGGGEKGARIVAAAARNASAAAKRKNPRLKKVKGKKHESISELTSFMERLARDRKSIRPEK